jgi:Ca2+-binding EF-hand superfamily protein
VYELWQAFNAFGNSISLDETKEIFKAFDVDKDGVISLTEF